MIIITPANSQFKILKENTRKFKAVSCFEITQLLDNDEDQVEYNFFHPETNKII